MENLVCACMCESGQMCLQTWVSTPRPKPPPVQGKVEITAGSSCCLCTCVWERMPTCVACVWARAAGVWVNLRANSAWLSLWSTHNPVRCSLSCYNTVSPDRLMLSCPRCVCFKYQTFEVCMNRSVCRTCVCTRYFLHAVQENDKSHPLILFTPIHTLLLSPHLGDGIRQQGVELLVGAVPNTTPASRVEVLPDATQANGHPLAEQGVGVWQLLQAVRYQVALQAGLLVGRRWTEGGWGGADRAF